MGWKDAPEAASSGWASAPEVGTSTMPRKSSAADPVSAVATGANQGFLGILGAPVDAVANLRDLVKAGIGSAVLAVQPKGNQQLPSWLEIGDRSNDVGSGDWLIKKARENAPSTVVAPDGYEGGYLQAGGRGLSAIINPRSRAELAQQAITGVIGSTAGKAAYDATGNPIAGVAGSLLGTAAVPKVASAVGPKLADATQGASQRLMQSAVKPTIAQLRTGDADTAVKTLLDYGINPTKGGVNQLRDLIDAKNAEISNLIGSSTAAIPKQSVITALGPVRKKFSAQVSPTSDLNAIQAVEDDFNAHPNFPGATIPVQAAQDMKQGTYSVLKGKYGQVGSAETEAQKGLARGLKDEIATAVPGVGPLNAEESRLLTTLSVTERRALMDMNKNPLGLASLASNPMSWAAFMADKSALFKSLAARLLNTSSKVPNLIGGDPTGTQTAYRAAAAVTNAKRSDESQ